MFSASFVNLWLCLCLGGQGGLPSGLENYAKAQAVLAQAVEAHGGAPLLMGLQSLAFDYEGSFHGRHKSRRLAAPYDETRRTMRVAYDLVRPAVDYDGEIIHVGGIPDGLRWIDTPEADWQLDMRRGTYAPDRIAPGRFEFVNRLVPALFMRILLQRPFALSWHGERQWNGRTYDCLLFAWENGRQYYLYFDGETHLLARYSFLMNDSIVGDAVSEQIFDDYRQQDGLAVNGRFTQSIDGALMTDVRLTAFSVNGDLSARFQPPADFTLVEAEPADSLMVEELGEGLWRMGDGTNFLLLVRFDSFGLVIDAPMGPDFTGYLWPQIEKRLAGLPLRYLVLTHHHDYHVAGLETFVKAGATVVTTAENETYLRGILNRRRVNGSVLEGQQPIRFHMVQDVFTVEEGARRLVLKDTGPSPHAEHMLVAWLPREEILFQADLLNVPFHGPAGAANESTAFLAGLIAREQWPVSRIVGTHGRESDLQELARLQAGPAPAKPVTTEDSGARRSK